MWKALRAEKIAGPVRARRWEHHGAERLQGVPSVHSAVEVAWVIDGDLEYEVHGKAQKVVRGEAYVVGAGTEHVTHAAASVKAGSLWLDPIFLMQLSEASFQGAQLATGQAARPERVGTLGRLLHEEILDGATEGLAADALTEALGIELLRGAPRRVAAGKTAAVARAVDFIHASYERALSMDEVSRAAALSRFELSRRFRVEVGTSPYQYVQQVRLEHAASRLTRTGATVTEAALSSGFSDLGRFSRAFKQRFGSLPNAYRRLAT
jgi:AraC-like DNA-binding protein